MTMRSHRIARTIISVFSAISLSISMVPAVAFAAPATGETFAEDGLWYTVTSVSPAQVSVGRQQSAGEDFAADDGAIVIPASVEHEGTEYAVTEIGSYAFSSGSDGADITSLAISEGVTAIGAYAFTWCKQLESMSIPLSVVKINKRAFAYCINLKDIAFEQPEQALPQVECLDGTFAGSAREDCQLEEILLPARLHYVPEGMFENQHALKTVRWAGTQTGYIGPRAFAYCTSIEYLEMPALKFTNFDGSSSFSLDGSGVRIGTNAFQNVNHIKTLVYVGPEDYGSVGSSSGTIERVIFRSTHTSNVYPAAARYYTMHFFANQQDAEEQENEIGHICVSSDIATKDITPALNAEGADIVYEGSVPDAGEGRAWFFPGAAINNPPGDSKYAFAVDANDLDYGTVALAQTSFSYTGKPVDLTCAVYSVTGVELPSKDFDLTVTDVNGAEVALDAVSEAGDYTLSAAAKEQSGYVGTATVAISIVDASCTWTRMSGNAANSTTNHVSEAAFKAGSLDTMILVGRSAWASGVAAAGLAGVREAAIVMTEDDSLSLEARVNLNRFKPSRVILIGIEASKRTTVADEVIARTTSAIESITTSLDGSTDQLTASNMFVKTAREGYWDASEQAVIASSADPATLLAIAPYAYATKSPVLLADDEGAIPAAAAEAIADGAFTDIILAGAEAAVPPTVQKQLSEAGFEGTYTRWGAAGSFAGAVEIAQEELASEVLGCDNLMLTSLDGPEYAVPAVSACGRNAALLLPVAEQGAGLQAIDDIVIPNRYSMKKAYVVGTRSLLSEQFLQRMVSLWSIGSADDLSLATMTLSPSTFTEGDEKVVPEVTVTDAEGTVLASGQYTLKYYESATDRVINVNNISAAGAYTVVARGVSSDERTFTNSCGAEFTIQAKPAAPSDSVKKGKTKLTLNTKTVKASSISGVDAKTVKEIVLGSKVKNVAAKAFSKCKKLAKLTVGKNVKKIGAQAFSGCTKLKTITVKTAKLAKKGVSKALKGSKVGTVKVAIGNAKTNKKYVKKYKKFFTKKNAGKAAKVKL